MIPLSDIISLEISFFSYLQFQRSRYSKQRICIFQHDILQNKLNEIFKSLSVNENTSPSEEPKKQQIPTYEQNFPELFYY